MLLIGCLFAFALAVAPRVVLVLAWIFSDRWQIVWSGQWLLPLLGIIFLPFTTVMYMLSWKPTRHSGLGLAVDRPGRVHGHHEVGPDRCQPQGHPGLPARGARPAPTHP